MSFFTFLSHELHSNRQKRSLLQKSKRYTTQSPEINDLLSPTTPSVGLNNQNSSSRVSRRSHHGNGDSDNDDHEHVPNMNGELRSINNPSQSRATRSHNTFSSSLRSNSSMPTEGDTGKRLRRTSRFGDLFTGQVDGLPRLMITHEHSSKQSCNSPCSSEESDLKATAMQTTTPTCFTQLSSLLRSLSRRRCFRATKPRISKSINRRRRLDSAPKPTVAGICTVAGGLYEQDEDQAPTHIASFEKRVTPIRPSPRQTAGTYHLDDFTFRRITGSGSDGYVHVAQLKSSGKIFAIKVLAKQTLLEESDGVNRVNNEREILASIDHPFVTKLHGTFQDIGHLFLVMDFEEGGELQAMLRKHRVSSTIFSFFPSHTTTQQPFFFFVLFDGGKMGWKTSCWLVSKPLGGWGELVVER